MTDETYLPVIEGLIFASEDPITADEILRAIIVIDGDSVEITKDDIIKSVELINTKYESELYPFKIMNIAGGYSFATKPELSKYLGYLNSEKIKRRLSQASLETLSIIAYRQPVTKPDIESIRGVNSDYILSTLLDKKLITIVGRAESVGRPLLYGTTDDFLKYFGLNKITDLPKPREIDELMQDEDFLEQKRKLLIQDIEETIEFELGDDN
ncbi:MAG: SMC-Scp complex subunit ScpB [Ignavibacteriales bacterium]|nr:MAG: SMC-Scp complex subunit ScpB [Ignavibacteriaceae bacterium]MBW7872350.1 SMC-Scp complex subunit ScpB [Ignavibacteria bacterium]MCZ2142633.1 SMC-Scp complex subunit ScpB [Ignavibacteriales bacterium]OQY71642.1 MAG: SMC-Scp complex subunit ScpB [Ignavibacteriales bacterium UTCHB3]MBV6445503.1 Segregation and condensation protein B [Ignavibacteriaceae bacterium]